MAAVSKRDPKFARSLKKRLDSLGCPYTDGADESWITDLVFTPGEPRIRLLQWLLSKYDLTLGEMVESSQTAVVGSKMDSRIQRLLFVVSNLGLCRYDDVDLIRGVDTSSRHESKQVAFIDQLLDIILIREAAEDPMTKSLLSPGIVSDSSPLEEQLAADCRYVDVVASLRPSAVFRTNVDLIPPDIKRVMKDRSMDAPSISGLKEMCSTVEQNLSRRMEALKGLKEVEKDPSANQLHRASESLDLILGELSQLVLSFTYCYENEMLPWCDKSPPHLSQLGPAFKRVLILTQQFSQLLQGLHQIHHSCQRLSEGVTYKVKSVDHGNTAFLAEVSQAAASNLQECVDILETSVQHEHEYSALSTSLCSSMLRL